MNIIVPGNPNKQQPIPHSLRGECEKCGCIFEMTKNEFIACGGLSGITDRMNSNILTGITTCPMEFCRWRWARCTRIEHTTQNGSWKNPMFISYCVADGDSSMLVYLPLKEEVFEYGVARTEEWPQKNNDISVQD